jgi:thiopurine S-methyltransferase
MKNGFWLERWKRNEIGFHQEQFNPYLLKYFQEMQLPATAQVFVPLCGKSHDMIWLREQGYGVLGVELSPIAVEAFFRENGYETRQPGLQRYAAGKFECSVAAGIRVLCGDFFDLNKDDVADVRAAYDRAALIALPEEGRKDYVRHLAGILPHATKMLLITVEYPQHEMEGPPFSVPTREVEALFAGYAELQQLANEDVLAQQPRFQMRGLSRLQENVFMLTTRPR